MRFRSKRGQWAEAVGLIFLIIALVLFLVFWPMATDGQKTQMKITATKKAEATNGEIISHKFLQAPVLTHKNENIQMSDLIRRAESDQNYRNDLQKAVKSFLDLEVSPYTVKIPGLFIGNAYSPGARFETGWRIEIDYPTASNPITWASDNDVDNINEYMLTVPTTGTRQIFVKLSVGSYNTWTII